MCKYIVAFMVAGLLLGCDSFQGLASEVQLVDRKDGKAALARVTDPALIVAGASLYQRHCAECHGDNGEGNADWRQRGSDGYFLPPPLNGTGHAWHHSRDWLVQLISDGTEPGGKMPGWRDKLSQQEIKSIVAWLQAQWPDKVYELWYEKQLAKLKKG